MPIDPEWQALKDEWDTYMASHSVMLTGGAHKATCPLCTDIHPTCRFTTGSLYCVNTDCGNPHHFGRNSRTVEETPPF